MPTYPITSPYNLVKAVLYAALTLAAPVTTLVIDAPPASSAEAPFKANHYYVTADATNNTVKLPAPSAVKAAGGDSAQQAGAVEVVLTNNPASTGNLLVQNSGGTQIALLPPSTSCTIYISGTTTTVTSGGGDVGFSQAVAAITGSRPGIELLLPITIPAGAGNTDIAAGVLPRAYEIVGAEFSSGGATGGTVAVKTAGGAAFVTDAMVPGNADVVTRNASLLLANNSFAAGAGFRVVAGAGNPGGRLYVKLLPR